MADAEWSPSPAVAYLEDGYESRSRVSEGWYHAPANALGAAQVIYRRGFYQVEEDINSNCVRGDCYCGALPSRYCSMDPPSDAELDAWVQDPLANDPAFWGAIEAHIDKHHSYPRAPNTLL
ncbi:hypothetical protein ACWD2L_06175 [Streptomyces sp. NPDC002754]